MDNLINQAKKRNADAFTKLMQSQMQTLKKDVEIPEVVQAKANEAFAKIRADEEQTHFTAAI